MSNLAYKFLYEPRVQELQRAIKESKQELKELKESTDKEARQFQNLVEQKQTASLELDEIKKKKSSLLLLIQNLEVKTIEANQSLHSEIQAKSVFIENTHAQNKVELQHVQEAKIDFAKEVQDTRNKLEAEIKRGIEKAEIAKVELNKELKTYAEKKAVLTDSIESLEQKAKDAQIKLSAELENQTTSLENCRIQTDKEVQVLRTRQSNLAETIKVLEENAKKEVLANKTNLESELIARRDELQQVEIQCDDLIEQKDKLTQEVKTVQDGLKAKIQAQESSVKEIKQTYETELSTLAEKKQSLNQRNDELETELVEAKRQLEAEQNKQTQFLESAKREYDKENERLTELRQSLSKLTTQITELEPVAKELQSFVSSKIEARQEYIQVQESLDKVTREKTLTLDEIQKHKEQMYKETHDLDAMKEYLKNFYGKVATYISMAKETVKQVNEALETNTPLYFDLPPELDKKIITFDNFNQYE